MAVRTIYGFDHPTLREKAKKVPKVDASIIKLIDDLAETMLAAPGAGLAAPQIGVQLRVFAGTAGFAVPSLEALIKAGHDLLLVLTQPDRPGHRNKIVPTPIKQFALKQGLHVYQPDRVGTPEAIAQIRWADPDLLVVVAYGQILPREVLEIPRHGALNVHASLLPRHRGAAPIAHAILAGDRLTGVPILRMDEQLH